MFGSPLIESSSLAPKAAKETVPAQAKKALSSASSIKSFGLTPRMKLLLGVGFCGSFTTASTMNLDVANMIGRGELMKATAYVMTNNVGGVCAAAAGVTLAKKIFRV